MSEYEIVTELFCPCAGDGYSLGTEIEEKELEDPEEYVRTMNGGEKCPPLKTYEKDGALVVEVDVSGNKRRYTFSLI